MLYWSPTDVVALWWRGGSRGRWQKAFITWLNISLLFDLSFEAITFNSLSKGIAFIIFPQSQLLSMAPAFMICIFEALTLPNKYILFLSFIWYRMTLGGQTGKNNPSQIVIIGQIWPMTESYFLESRTYFSLRRFLM